MMSSMHGGGPMGTRERSKQQATSSLQPSKRAGENGAYAVAIVAKHGIIKAAPVA